MTPQYGHRPTILQTPNPDITIPRRRGEEGIVRTHVDIRHDARVTPQGTNQNRPAHIRAGLRVESCITGGIWLHRTPLFPPADKQMAMAAPG